MAADTSEFTPLTSKPKRRPFLVLDLESKEDDTQRAGFTRPFMGGVYDGSEFHAFFDQDRGGDWQTRYHYPGGCIDRMMKFILRDKYAGHHIYAHNAGRFDYLFLLTWLMTVGERMGFMFSLIPVSSSIQVLDVWKKGSGKKKKWKRWRFLDSLRLIPIGLDKAGKTFGVGGKLEHDLHLPEWDKRWLEYNRVDCVKLYEVLEKFHHYVEDVLLGEIGVTAPATAVKLLRRRYLKAPIARNVHTHEFIRRGYFGGRVEVFKKSGQGLRYYDINSSYPAAMLEMMPGGDCSEWDGEPPERFRRDPEQGGRIGFCEVKVVVPRTLHIPPLPVRGDGKLLPKGKLLFPTGNLYGIWEWSELQQAIEMGCEIVWWGKSYWYEAIPLFREYAQDLYAYRDKSHPDYNDGMAAIAKLLLNSSYGKFGMNTLRKKIYKYDDPDLPDNAVPADNDPECLVWYAEEEVDACYIMPQIAARVTAVARVALLRHMLAAEELGGELHYCDTDSLITNVEMPTSTELGGLKDEYPEQSGKLRGEFLGPKMYALDTEDGFEGEAFELIKAKGFPGKYRTRETIETLKEGGVITMQRLEKVGTLAKAGFRRGPRMVTVPKRLHFDAGKRRIFKDGSTSPHYVEMWEDDNKNV